jgi:hypothetical protein
MRWCDPVGNGGAVVVRRAGRAIRRVAPMAAAVVAVAMATLVNAAAVLAASPSPTQGAGGDPRSAGQGPGLVGDPLLAIVVVTLIAVASLGVTLLYVRATGASRRT